MSLQVLFALNQTLLQHEGVRAGSLQGSYTTEDLITHYNCGDLSSIIFNRDTSQVGLLEQQCEGHKGSYHIEELISEYILAKKC